MLEDLRQKYDSLKSLNLAIDLTRGKPHADQLDLSNELLHGEVDFIGENDIDLRNYGEPIGIIEARKLGAELLDSKLELTMAGEQSSYLLMTQMILGRFLLGLEGREQPWRKEEEIAFLCTVPGFDRHFATLDGFGIKMLTLNLCEDGIDLQHLQERLQENNNIKGIICVPRHSNPSGEVFTDQNITSFLELTKAYNPNFINLFDHAYLIHDFAKTLKQTPIPLLAQQIGALDNIAVFTSFSKVTFGGGGLSFLTTGPDNFAMLQQVRNMMVICPDKINQKRHVNFLQNKENIQIHMQKHATLIKPKFDLVVDKLKRLPKTCGTFTEPTGGYFVTYYASKPVAKRIVELCKGAGLLLTPAGSTFPYGNDPNDAVLRIAPTYIDLQQLELAMDIFTVAAQIADIEI